MKENIKKYAKFLIAPFITTIILLIIYWIKGIYPFGTMTVANGDMGQSYMTFYHFLYDVVYNGKSIFYDYTLGMGSNMYGSFIVDGLLNPSAFIVLLSSRENIPYMFSFVLMIKIAFIALTSYILFNKLYKNNYYNIIFSVLYGLSAYALMYNTNIMWLDVAGLFPLFILSIKHMFDTHKVHWYSIVLALMLIYNYNMAYMVLMFIIFAVPLYVLFVLPKDQRKKATFDIILGTALAGGISAFAFIPSFVQAISSYRMSGELPNTTNNVYFFLKLATLIFYALPLYGFFKWIKHYKKDLDNILAYGMSLMLMAIIPIIFERVNLELHGGSYQMFPFRYGFIPIMILYIGALRYFNYYAETRDIIEKGEKILLVVECAICIYAFYIGIENVLSLNKRLPSFFLEYNNFLPILISNFLIIISMKVIEKIGTEKIKKLLFAIIALVQVFTYTYAYIGVYKEYRYRKEWSDEVIFESYDIANELTIDKSLYRMKDLTYSFTENCPLVYNIPSMSTFLHIISKEQILNCQQLGYSSRETIINDYGGTIFSDAVYGIKYVLTKNDLSDKIYNYVQTTSDGKKLYEYKNVLPIGITYDNQVANIPKELKIFDAQNYLYRNLFGKQDDIIKKLDIDEDILQLNKSDKTYTYKIKIEKCSQLYVYLEKIMKKITINGEELIIPTIRNQNNTYYPNSTLSGILDLGTYENETVEIEFELYEENTQDSDIQLATLDIDKYNELFEGRHSSIEVRVENDKIYIKGNSDKDTNLFIPINYDKGWRVSSNSAQNTQIEKVYNNFISVQIKKGENDIELQFRPFLYELGVVISIITVIAMIGMHFLERKFNIRNVKWIMNAVWSIALIVYAVCLVKIYLINILQTFIN